MADPVRVYLETGKTWVFACALDWPGWARKGRGPDAALETLDAYRGRYGEVAGRGFRPGPLEVVGEVSGYSGTDFGIPGVVGDWDNEPIDRKERGRQARLLSACWSRFDQVVAEAPTELKKGRRGGGRDRDAIVEHVREAERGYGPRLGLRIAPRTAWMDQRRIVLEALQAGTPGSKWPPRYSLRRLAWHVLDHAWEIEDKGIHA